jgi:hypothetical protein
VNTGTWADLVRVPDAVLADGADDALSKFLADLVHDSGVRWFHPTFADLRVNADGHVERASVQQA